MSFPAPPRSTGAMTMTVPPQAARPDPVERVRSPRIAALGTQPDKSVVDGFWAEVAASGAPLLEDVANGSCTYTFVHRGGPDTQRVALLGNKIADPRTLAEALFAHVPGTDIWWYSMRLGSGWRGSYAIAAQDDCRPETPEPLAEMIESRRHRALAAAAPEHREQIGEWFDLQHFAGADPFAREAGRGGGYLPSVASGPDAPVPLTLTSAAAGRIVPVGDAVRSDLWWHIPAAPAPTEWDVLVLLDGERWLGSGDQLDAWQASGVLPPTVTLLVGSGPLEQRVHDLTCSPELVDDLVRVLGSAASDPGGLFGAPLTADPARTRIAGQSLGGLTALYAQCAAPERFGVSVCQSGSFWWPNAQGEAEWLTRAIAATGVRLGAVSLEVGLQEWVLLEPVRRLRDVVAGSCAQLFYREFDGGHDEACWSASLPSLLRETLPGA